MSDALILKTYRSSDCSELAALFYETVHRICCADYTPAQLDAWADGRIDLDLWDHSFQAHHTVVAWKAGRIVGFGDSTAEGYLDRLYVRWDCQRQGIAAAICERLESRLDVDRIYTHASITARPFFEARGYRVLRSQQVERHGIWLTNFVMEKRLDPEI